MKWFKNVTEKFQRTHEEKLFAMTRLERFGDNYVPRFVRNEDGHVWNGYYLIQDKLWEWYVKNERWPNSYHKFVGDTQPIVKKGQEAWPLRRAECSRCGEKREISFFLDPSTIKDGWCI